MDKTPSAAPPITALDANARIPLSEMLAALRRNLALLVLAPLAVGGLALAITGYIAPTFTASTSFMPPQQSQGAAASALASLGTLGQLAGLSGGSGLGGSADRYVGLMQSVTLSDRIVDHFELMAVYETKYRVDARKSLAENVRISVGKKDGLISVEVDDKSPQRAAAIANRYVTELRSITASLAVTEAQQRREFFDQQLKLSRDRLVLAQQALQTSGFNAGALKAEPRAAADAYARLRAEATAAEVKLQTLRNSLTERAPEVQQQQSELVALRGQLARAEQATTGTSGPDYIGRYREFKYQEALFDLYARQLEIARVDESREGALIQVVDPATPPEKKSKPKRVLTSLISTLFTLLGLIALVLVRLAMRPPDHGRADHTMQASPA